MQSVLKVLYPDRCMSCGDQVAANGALCGPCWQATPFIGGTVCDICGQPLVGDDPAGTALCDDCQTTARPWVRGRAALIYRDNGRRLVLALKHGDRLDLARPAARWMAQAGATFLRQGMAAVPVPAHPWRLLRRRYNQAAILAQSLSRHSGLEYLPDALVRIRTTRTQDGMSKDERFRNMSGAIRPHPRRSSCLRSRAVVIVDDVMTSGATLSAAAEAAYAAGATEVCVLVLARVAKET